MEKLFEIFSYLTWVDLVIAALIGFVIGLSIGIFIAYKVVNKKTKELCEMVEEDILTLLARIDELEKGEANAD